MIGQVPWKVDPLSDPLPTPRGRSREPSLFCCHLHLLLPPDSPDTDTHRTVGAVSAFEIPSSLKRAGSTREREAPWRRAVALPGVERAA